MEAVLMHTDPLIDEAHLCGDRLWVVTNKMYTSFSLDIYLRWNWAPNDLGLPTSDLPNDSRDRLSKQGRVTVINQCSACWWMKGGLRSEFKSQKVAGEKALFSWGLGRPPLSEGSGDGDSGRLFHSWD